MINKRYRVKMTVVIDAVTCPGVWLCPYGLVELSLRTMGYNYKTAGVEPRFPLLFHQKFHIEGFYRDGVRTLESLEERLAREKVDMSLYQRGTRLAFFSGHLGVLLKSPTDTFQPEIISQILMRSTQSFPGIISPKIELITKIQVTEDHPGIPPKIYYVIFGSQLERIERICSKESQEHFCDCWKSCHENARRHQKPVCHVKKEKCMNESHPHSNYSHSFIPISGECREGKQGSVNDRSSETTSEEEESLPSSYAQ
ncbi:uncharacterized protein DMENIID0001_010740 [Sergentomyia squamirostris]